MGRERSMPNSSAYLLHEAIVEVFVLLRKWVDARVKQILGNGQLPRERLRRERSRIELL